MYVVRAELTPSSLPLPVAGQVANAESAEVDRDALLSSYYELRDRVVQKAEAGRFEDALPLCDEALGLAERCGDQGLADQAYCNRSEIALMLGYPVDSGRLREILMRNSNYSMSFSAAYLLAQSFRMLNKQYKKALFYARIARDRALAAGNSDHIAKSRNEIGNCLLAESYFEEAEEEYVKALDLVRGPMTAFHVPVFVNLGYLKIMLGNHSGAFRILFTALRWCRRNPDENGNETWAHLALSLAFLEIRRWRYAWWHGQRGLEQAESMGAPDAIKTALYLLGEVEKSGGDRKAAYQYYSRLQREFYPQMGDLAQAMLFVETKQLVNLRA